MTEDFIETIWTQFGIESAEHFESIERLLIAAETGAVDAGNIAELFRSFHSIKGMCKSMDLSAMETIAHRAEDLLDLVRSGRAALDAELSGLLLQALDALQTLSRQVMITRADGVVPQALLDRLRQAYAVRITSSARTESVGQAAASSPSIANTPSQEALAEDLCDPEMLGYFLEYLNEQIPLLIQQYQVLFSGMASQEVPALLEGLKYAADVMKFVALVEIFQQLNHQLDSSNALTPTKYDGTRALLRDLQKHLIHLEQRANKDANAGMLGAFLETSAPGERSESSPEPDVSPLAVGGIGREPQSKPNPAATVNALETKSNIAANSTPLTPAIEASAPAGKTFGDSGTVIRVPSEALEHFMNKIGEVILARSRLDLAARDEQIREILWSCQRDWQEQHPELLKMLASIGEALAERKTRLLEADADLRLALMSLQEDAMALRVVPMETVFKRFPRLVRDLSHAENKQVRLAFCGEEVRIDKTMVEILADPLMHMLRNSVDHGIETVEERIARGKPVEATITLRARQQGSRVIVQVCDDGGGIDTPRVLAKALERGLVDPVESHTLSREQIEQLIFLPGFSTAEKITETSGRGVGMDVVRNNISRLGGTIHVQSEMGKGCTITIQLPLSAAIQEVLLVEVAQQILALPRRYMQEVITYEVSSVQSLRGRQALLHREAFLPIVRLDELLRLPLEERVSPPRKEGLNDSCDSHTAVVIAAEQHRLALEINGVRGYTDLFVKDIHPSLTALPGVGGAAILGDGSVVLILDGDDLFDLAERMDTRAA